MIKLIHNKYFKLYRWARKNLFYSLFSTIISLFCIYLLFICTINFLNWAVVKADFLGITKNDCTSGGACWVFVKTHLYQFIYGFYPSTEYWRVNLAGLLLVIAVILLFYKKIPGEIKSKIALFTLFVYPIIAFCLLRGGFGLKYISTLEWGGLMLTMVIAVVGITLSFPFGTLIAIGRYSKMPIIKYSCVTFVELIRGVPLITLLFMGSVMLPLFVPEKINFDKLLRALIIITLFQSAYISEVVRGGLQGIAEGQYEASKTLGFNYWQKMRLIILPQVFRIIIPGLVNTFIALFKDTTLISIIGLLDLLGIVQSSFQNTNWLGTDMEGLIFVCFIFWMFNFFLSSYGKSLEKKLHTQNKHADKILTKKKENGYG
ncbi:amino acid ABC transporter permease [Pseudomonadota bacterium]